MSERHPVVVGFSGGLDSSVLLDVCVAAFGAAAVVACHVNHRLQAGADDWERHCRLVSAGLNCRYESVALDVPAVHPPGGIEDWARNARRAALFDACAQHSAAMLMLAHHASDQVETLLLNWGRGCGLEGMQGMHAVSRQQGVLLVRPWLDVPGETLRDYARQSALAFVTDPSNASLSFRRNRVRHELLPMLQSAFPGFDGNVLRHAQLVRSALGSEGETVSTGETWPGRASLSGRVVVPLPVAGFDRTVLAGRDTATRENSLRAWIRANGLRAPGMARSRHLREQLVDSAAVRGEVAHDGRLLRRFRDFVSNEPDDRHWVAPAATAFDWQGEAVKRVAPWPGEWRIGKLPGRHHAAGSATPPGLPAHVLSDPELLVVPLRMSARMRVRPGGPARRLKQLCQEAGIAVWTRRAMPMLQLRGQVVHVAGLGINHEWHMPARLITDAIADHERRFGIDYLDESC